jgi:3'-phosphoadenosine 5'-phosphosulfate sulfotransferase (PAPS reductase)/FAD synthetase
MKKDIICWWSGGITSAVACKKAIELFGKKRCRVVMIDTCNEHEDTYRFKKDCAEWYGIEIEVISGIGERYGNITDVWKRFKSLNVAHGAICSSELKREVREKWQDEQVFTHQVFGFEFDKKEFNRGKSLTMNHPKSKPIYPLLMFGLNKEDCIRLVEDEGIDVPVMYKMGFRNNNCFKTGCVQGGVGYWQKMKVDFPDKFDRMADMEHELTALRGKPVTMLKDQSKAAKASGNTLVFLRKHPEYPHLKCIDDMPSCKVEPLFECNGFCGTNDLIPRKESEGQINFEFDF